MHWSAVRESSRLGTTNSRDSQGKTNVELTNTRVLAFVLQSGVSGRLTTGRIERNGIGGVSVYTGPGLMLNEYLSGPSSAVGAFWDLTGNQCQDGARSTTTITTGSSLPPAEAPNSSVLVLGLNLADAFALSLNSPHVKGFSLSQLPYAVPDDSGQLTHPLLFVMAVGMGRYETRSWPFPWKFPNPL